MFLVPRQSEPDFLWLSIPPVYKLPTYKRKRGHRQCDEVIPNDCTDIRFLHLKYGPLQDKIHFLPGLIFVSEYFV